MARMKNQLSEKKKIAVADMLIDNSGEMELEEQIEKIHRAILSLE